MSADAVGQAMQTRAEFTERLAAQLRTLTNYDLARLTGLLEPIWLGTQLTLSETAQQRADDVPDNVLAAIPLSTLATVRDYIRLVESTNGPWRNGIVYLLWTTAKAEEGLGVPNASAASDPATRGLWVLWPRLSPGARVVFVVVLALTEALILWLGFVSVGFAFLAGYLVAMVLISVPFGSGRKPGVPSPANDEPLELGPRARRSYFVRLRQATPTSRRRALVGIALWVAAVAVAFVSLLLSSWHLGPAFGAVALALLLLASRGQYQARLPK